MYGYIHSLFGYGLLLNRNLGGSLGLYGWAGSPYEDMDANVGLHDGIAALEWTKKYISKFGGDPDRITVFGQSAGAAMIQLMLTANEGKEELPFSKVYPAYYPPFPRKVGN